MLINERVCEVGVSCCVRGATREGGAVSGARANDVRGEMDAGCARRTAAHGRWRGA